MRISIANVSQRITAAEFKTAVHAIERQVHEDFAPLWGMDASIRVIQVDRNTKPDPDAALSDALIYVGEIGDDPGAPDEAVGYHAGNLRGIPYGFVFQDIAKKTGEQWTTTLSHEVLELIADPEVNLYVLGPHPSKRRKLALRCYEVCDPVQGDTYTIDTIEVSNFVTPLYFAELPHPTITQTNYLKLPLKRFGVRPNGYYSYVDLDTHRTSDVYGDETSGPRIAKVKSALRSARRQHRRSQLLGVLLQGQEARPVIGTMPSRSANDQYDRAAARKPQPARRRRRA